MEHICMMRIAVLSIAVMIAACGDNQMPATMGDGDQPPPVVPPKGVAVIKFRAVGSTAVALMERLRAIEDVTAPDRSLTVSSDGTGSPVTIEPPRPDG
jgi:hypothetical protein